MRRTISVPGAVFLALAGCNFKSTPPESAKVEEKLGEMFEKSTGTKPDKVDCPDGNLEGKLQCTAHVKDLAITLDVEIKKGEGGPFSGWDLEYHTAPGTHLLDPKQLTDALEKWLAGGGVTAKVTCPDYQGYVPLPGRTITCKSDPGDLVITVKDTEGNVSWELRPAGGAAAPTPPAAPAPTP